VATRLTRFRNRLVAAFGRPDPMHAKAAFVIDHGLRYLPPEPELRQDVARLCRIAIVGGYRPGAGLNGVRRALNVRPDLGDVAVAPELAALLNDLEDEITPSRWD
jgi:hypothetical protein